MCGRFAVTLPQDAMAQLFNARPANDLPVVPNSNVCPTDDIHVIRRGGEDDAPRSLEAMRWGFLPRWYKALKDGPLLINARAETMAEKPAFRDAARHRRCLIPASGFYEWTKDEGGAKQPWYITRTDEAPIAFAGLWQDWERNGVTCRTAAIVTCAANAEMADLHHRMPVIVEPEEWALWLGEDGKAELPNLRAQPAPLSFKPVTGPL
ncbi:Putative SOS response-associated peptidase YedK [Roseivivax halotolerans]|uniref:Abasic site processing protein n=1 Tax=Roseivivax halotolerans TaxID=93684 RepID=A0A1I5W7V2_9RHOB|nr:SOS response-associated peptidase [Roseivivax halotolerans]SFQ15832.1 Putative SOS response-associated peptidase YedK [Roseivivax halotolerans]